MWAEKNFSCGLISLTHILASLTSVFDSIGKMLGMFCTAITNYWLVTPKKGLAYAKIVRTPSLRVSHILAKCCIYLNESVVTNGITQLIRYLVAKKKVVKSNYCLGDHTCGGISEVLIQLS